MTADTPTPERPDAAEEASAPLDTRAIRERRLLAVRQLWKLPVNLPQSLCDLINLDVVHLCCEVETLRAELAAAEERGAAREREAQAVLLAALKEWKESVEALDYADMFPPPAADEVVRRYERAHDALRSASDALSPRTERLTVGTEEALSESRPVGGEGFGELAYRLAEEGKRGDGEWHDIKSGRGREG